MISMLLIMTSKYSGSDLLSADSKARAIFLSRALRPRPSTRLNPTLKSERRSGEYR
ncbi:MAG: hypothetical protein QXL26_02005 [Zestosphaera sp.]